MGYTVYKVVDTDTQPGKLLSARVEGVHKTEYIPLEWKYLSNMFVFAYLKDAEECVFGAEIWEAETPETHHAPEYVLPLVYVDEYFEVFWADPEGGTGKCMTRTPVGTVLCDSLRLIRPVGNTTG